MTLFSQTLFLKLTMFCTLRFIVIVTAIIILMCIVDTQDFTLRAKPWPVSRTISQFSNVELKNSDKFLFEYEQTKNTAQTLLYLDGNMTEKLINISKMIRLKDVNCKTIFDTSPQNVSLADFKMLNPGNPIQDETYINLTSNCRDFQLSRGYIMSSLTEEEEDFPLAYSMIVYKDAEMVERLLRAIYRPQNYYCIHVDKKSSDVFYRAVSSIANCFLNVFLTTRRLNVRWGKFSALEPELQCMEELWRYPKWKYFMTLTGQEFPLKTNSELVKILTAYDGANDIECTIRRASAKRWSNTIPPQGVTPIKGSVHITVNRDYVDYVLHNETAHTILKWVKETKVPDETFFATLHCNKQLGIKGSYTGSPDSTKPVLSRFKHWHKENSCAGIFVRRVCILSTGDLPELSKARQLFANKFYLQKDRVVIGCLEEKIFNDTRDEFIGVKVFNSEYYAGLDFVKNKVVKVLFFLRFVILLHS